MNTLLVVVFVLLGLIGIGVMAALVFWSLIKGPDDIYCEVCGYTPEFCRCDTGEPYVELSWD